MSEVEFQPGCIVDSGIAICGPGGVVIQETGRCEGLCEKTDARLVVRYPNSAYYGPIVQCECGDSFDPGESWLYPRPFRRGWRKKAQERFEVDWAKALPMGTKPVYGSDPDDDWFAFLIAVTMPDGTEVKR